MTAYQFERLIAEIRFLREDVVEKLEQIRMGVIDVETEIEKLRTD